MISASGVPYLYFLATKCENMIRITASSIPGTIPARNRSVIDTPAITPYIISAMLGGISGPNAPAAAAIEHAKVLS